jgi:hypothetical protein
MKKMMKIDFKIVESILHCTVNISNSLSKA